MNSSRWTWDTADRRIYHALDGVPVLGPIYRALVGLWTNSVEPMPAGGQRARWAERPQWQRYLLWHVRNPSYDFRNFTIGIYDLVERGRTTFRERIWWWGRWEWRFTTHRLTGTRLWRWVYLPRMRIVFQGDQHPMIYLGWMRNGRFGTAAKAVLTAGPWYSRALASALLLAVIGWLLITLL